MSHVSRGHTAVRPVRTAEGYSDVALDAPSSLATTRRWGNDVAANARQIDSPMDVSASVYHGPGATSAKPDAGLQNGLDRALASARKLPVQGSDATGLTRTADREKGAGANPPAPVE